jgi:hypothetical protein
MQLQPACPKCGYGLPELIEARCDKAKAPDGRLVTVEVYECGCGHRFSFVNYDGREPASDPRWDL